MDSMNDCNNCKHHVQGSILPICTDCLTDVTHDNLNLKNWESNEVMSDERPAGPGCDGCMYEAVSSNSEPCSDCGGVFSYDRYVRGILTMPPMVEATAPVTPPNAGSVHDPVESPKHYMLFPDMEAIEAMRSLLSHEEYVGYLKGNILKYRFRAGRKGNDDAKTLQDIAKAEQYSKFLALVS